MREKGLVVCDTRQRPQVYRAKQSQRSTLRHLAGDLLERVFGGSARALLLHALDAKRCQPEELSEIRDMLDELEREGS
jgi:predicted transcriptional regulator